MIAKFTRLDLGEGPGFAYVGTIDVEQVVSDSYGCAIILRSGRCVRVGGNVDAIARVAFDVPSELQIAEVRP